MTSTTSTIPSTSGRSVGSGLRVLADQVAGAAATAAGTLARRAASVPGLLGAGCAVSAAWDGLGRPAGLAVLSLFLLLIDRRIS
jgi:hypothetical protein